MDGDFAHAAERLADGGEAGDVVGGGGDVVEADDGDVVGAAEAGVGDGADGTDGGDVVEAEDGGEVAGAGEEVADGGVAELGGPGVGFEVDAEVGVDGEADSFGHGHDAFPAEVGVGDLGLTFHEGDAAVAEVVEVLEGEEGGAVVVQHDVGVALDFFVAGDGDDGGGDFFVEGGVDEEEAVDGALGEEAGVLVDEVGLALVGDDEVEVAGLEEVLFDAVHEHGEVALGEFGDDDADGVGVASAEGTGDGVGAVVEALGGLEDAVAGGGGDGGGAGRVVHDERDGGGGEAEVLGEDLEVYGLGRFGGGFAGGHGFQPLYHWKGAFGWRVVGGGGGHQDLFAWLVGGGRRGRTGLGVGGKCNGKKQKQEQKARARARATTNTVVLRFALG